MGIKQGIQSFGRKLTNMIMPNIGAFIAWGFITALFIPAGWLPNEALAKMVGPMITYLLPLLIAYSGGKMVYDTRGGVAGAIVVMGVIVGTGVPMFLGAMIVGPLAGWVMKKFDGLIEGKIPAGFEMLVNNFSIGIICGALAIGGFFVIGPSVEALTQLLKSGVDFLVNRHLIELSSIFVEPAKVLFLNNAINHGVFTPLGISEAQSTGKSLLFLIEANPGAGLGLLLAYWYVGKGTIKQSAPGAIIIHFFGGIHEIYFPYVLMNPILILGMIAGGITNVTILSLMHGGLIAPSSPGSILAVLAMTPKGGYVPVLAAVFGAALVSFIVNSLLLKFFGKNDTSLEAAMRQTATMKAESKATSSSVEMKNVKKIYTACDAGMGSSAMGAGNLAKALKNAGLGHIKTGNLAINNLTPDIDIVITHRSLTPLAKAKLPNARHISIDNFMDKTVYNELVEELLKSNKGNTGAAITSDTDAYAFKLAKSDIQLAGKAKTRVEAIKEVGELLVSGGYTTSAYIPAMLKREEDLPTYLGNGIAIPHGVKEASTEIKKSGVVLVQYPEGIDWDGEMAYLVFGIAAKKNEHAAVLQRISDLFDDEEALTSLKHTKSVDTLLIFLNKEI